MIDDPESNGSHPGAWARMLRHNWRDVRSYTDKELSDPLVLERIKENYECKTNGELLAIVGAERLRRTKTNSYGDNFRGIDYGQTT
jgi:hypothetical protein